MSVIRWEDPPPASVSRKPERSKLDHGAIAACLRRRPGAWALVDEGSWSGTHTTAIRTGSLFAYRPCGSFDAVARQVNGITRLYVRYLGDPSAVGGERSDNPNASDLGDGS